MSAETGAPRGRNGRNRPRGGPGTPFYVRPESSDEPPGAHPPTAEAIFSSLLRGERCPREPVPHGQRLRKRSYYVASMPTFQ
jgi:hypothetical protein